MNAPKRILPQVLSALENKILWRYLHRPRDKALFGLTLFLGLRISEAIRVRLDELDLQAYLLRGTGKGGKAFELPLPPHLEAILIEALQARPPQATHPYLLWRLDDPTQPLSRSGAWKIVRRLGLQALGRPLWPHLMRHSFATFLYQKTMDLGQVQRALRHSKIQTTTIYAQLATEDLRKPIASLDHRSWLRRRWEGLKPRVLPDLLKRRGTPLVLGETVGREQELTQMRKVFRAGGRHCVLVGDPGVGRKTLLKALYEEQKERRERAYALDGLKPVKTALAGLYESMKRDGLLVGELPSDTRAGKVWLDAMRQATKGQPVTVFIYDSDEPNLPGLRELAKVGTVFTATTPEKKRDLRKALFNFQEIEILPLGREAAFMLAEKALDEKSITLPNRQGYLSHIFRQSGGNARALLWLVAETQGSGEREPEYLGRGRERSAAPIVYFVLATSAVLRYSASSTGHPEWKLFLGALCLIAGAIGLICRVYKD
jgi:hypothetical protein